MSNTNPYFPALDRAKFALTVRFRVKPESVPAFRNLLVARVATARKDEAVVDFRLFDTEDPHEFLVFESFPSRAAWSEFAQRPETKTFLAEVAALLAAPFEAQKLELVG